MWLKDMHAARLSDLQVDVRIFEAEQHSRDLYFQRRA